MSKPASHLRGQQLCPVDQDMSENLFPDLGPQRARAPGPFSSEVQTKVEWKGLQEQEHSEGQPQAKTLFCSGKGGLMGETCHAITSRILTDSSGIREKLHPQLQLWRLERHSLTSTNCMVFCVSYLLAGSLAWPIHFLCPTIHAHSRAKIRGGKGIRKD